LRAFSGMKGSNRHGPRTRLEDSETRLSRKRRQEEEGRTRGLVEIPGPLPEGLEQEIRNLAAKLEAEAAERRPGASLVAITPFAEGLAIETSGEKLAQQIADALVRSRHVRLERAFDDEGRRRILTCHLPSAGEG